MATIPESRGVELEHSAALTGVNARERSGMRRQFEYRDAEQVERLRRFVAGTPFPRRG
jgi:hypothetical protein